MIAKKKKKKYSRPPFLYIFAFVLVAFLGVTLAFGGFLASQTDVLEGRFYPHVSIDGIDMSRKTQQEALALLAPHDDPLKEAAIIVLYEKQPIATFSATILTIASSLPETLSQAYTVGRSQDPKTRAYQRFNSLFNLMNYNFETVVLYDTKPLKEFIAQAHATYGRPATNARFAFEDGRVTSFAPEAKGIQINDKNFYTDVERVIKSLKRVSSVDSKPVPSQVTLTTSVLEPKIRLSAANQFGIEELIGTGKSNFAGSIPGRVHNLTLASSRLNGVLIEPGRTFSFNDAVGDISAHTGYQQAYIIQNGRTVLGDGGGVCQVSTTLFRAALNTGLPIVERTAHAYRVGYYENDSAPGLDATVYSPTVDLKIKNDTPGYILIQTVVDPVNSALTFNVYGKKDGRVAQVSAPVVYDQSPAPPPRNEDDPTMKKGQTKQVDFAAAGAKARFSYKVTRAGKTLIAQDFFSSYRPWQAVFLVGTAD